MVISENSQLLLRRLDKDEMLQYLSDCSLFLDREIVTQKTLKIESERDDKDLPYSGSGDELYREINQRLGYNAEMKGSEFYLIKHPTPYTYLILPSVHSCAEKIKLGENFSCAIFNKIKDGDHNYLLGKNEFFTFVKFNGVIRGSYWNNLTHVAFEVGFHLGKDIYFYPQTGKAEFNRLVRLMTFIELGDIEIEIIEKGRNNGKSKKAGKITNTSDYTVFVVDSSWNKIVIRTDGFAVAGHFRLQPCGVNHADRKLIWIDAFEKHGYNRRPKAEIIHN